MQPRISACARVSEYAMEMAVDAIAGIVQVAPVFGALRQSTSNRSYYTVPVDHTSSLSPYLKSLSAIRNEARL